MSDEYKRIPRVNGDNTLNSLSAMSRSNFTFNDSQILQGLSPQSTPGLKIILKELEKHQASMLEGLSPITTKGGAKKVTFRFDASTKHEGIELINQFEVRGARDVLVPKMALLVPSIEQAPLKDR